MTGVVRRTESQRDSLYLQQDIDQAAVRRVGLAAVLTPAPTAGAV